MAGTGPVGYNSLNDRQPSQFNGSRSGNHEQVAHDGEGRPQRPRHAEPVVTQFTTSQINYGYDPCANCSPVSNFGDSLSPSTSAKSTAAVGSDNPASRSLPSFSFGQGQGYVNTICPRLPSNIGQQHLPIAFHSQSVLKSSVSNEQQSNNAPAPFGTQGRVADDRGVAVLANASGQNLHQQSSLPVPIANQTNGPQNPAQPHPKLVCTMGSKTIGTGGPDGCLIVSDVKTGHIYSEINAHTGSVTALDAWCGFVVSTGVDQVLNVYRLVKGTLMRAASAKLPSVPGDVKLVELDGGLLNKKLCVAVVGHTVTHCDYYTFKKHTHDGSLWIYKSVCVRDPTLDSFICQELSLNVRRTHYAVIGKRHTNAAGVIAGVVGSDVACDLIVNHSGQFRYFFSWKVSNHAFWFTGNDVSSRCIWSCSRYIIPENRSDRSNILSSEVQSVDEDELGDLTD